MTKPPASVTLLLPEAARRAAPSLSPDLLSQSVRRLRILVLLYAFTFFMAGFFPSLLFAEDRARLVNEPANWVPGVLSIGRSWCGRSRSTHAFRCHF